MDILSSLNTGGSGLNISELTETLTNAEIEPRKSLITQRIDTAELRLSGYERLRGQTETLNDMLSLMRQLSPLTVRSDTSAVRVSVSDAEALDIKSAQVSVGQLASPQVLNFTGYASANSEVGAGALTVAVGSWSDDVPSVFTQGPSTATTISFAEGSTLADVAEALNMLEGVSARVIDSGDGTFSLGVTSETGATNALHFSVDTAADSRLAALDFSADPNVAQVQAAANAELSLNGIPVTRASNTVSDLLPGVELTLTATTMTPATISATPDVEGSLEVMQGFIDMINATRTLFKDLTTRGFGSTGTAGDLAGDTLTESLMFGMENVLARNFGSSGIHLADIGVMTERDGRLSIDANRFERVVTANPAVLNTLIHDDFSAVGAEISGTPTVAPNEGSFRFIRDPETGAASINGVALVGQEQEDGRWLYDVKSGPLRGISITVEASTETAEVNFAPSIVSSLQTYLGDALENDASLAKRENSLRDTIAEESLALDGLDTRSEELRTRYLARFTEMERVITQLNSTGDYLTNLIDAWNSKD